MSSGNSASRVTLCTQSPLRTLALALFIFSTACENSAPQGAPHIVIVSLDTLRADHLPTYGYEKPTAPRIDDFARNAIVFDRAYSSASHTLAAHASLLTGVAPERHGLIDLDDVLPRGVVTLASILEDHGYRTGAFVNAGFLHPKFGMHLGFERYDYFNDMERRQLPGEAIFGRDAEETNRAVFTWLDEADDRPVFLFVHYFDVHSDWDRLPYEAPDDYLARFSAPRPAETRLEAKGRSASMHLRALNRDRVALGEGDRTWLRALYDAGIAYTDTQIGALLDFSMRARFASGRSSS